MISSTSETARPPRVFLSYADEDKAIARRVAEAFQASGGHVWLDEWELGPGDSIASRVDEALASADVIVVLLSHHALESRWIQAELAATLAGELRDRAITVIPALIEDCEVPTALYNRLYLDLRDDLEARVRRFATQFHAIPDVDFTLLDAPAFEALITDLLTTIGFVEVAVVVGRDIGFDLVASYRTKDPFGAEKTEKWLVQTKLYKQQRVGVQVLMQLLGALSSLPGINHGLVVTNSRLTSVAREFLAEHAEKTGHAIRVVDGAELVTILVQHPDLMRRHFRGSQLR
ncbi:TIR domain-containing protein [Sorangium sp. So ce362]|uniref:TIR domain-containing protein n=1 Tax=Sorangium sp. So ce362 TaxID=3133303 RepID=UPI003F62A918